MSVVADGLIISLQGTELVFADTGADAVQSGGHTWEFWAANNVEGGWNNTLHHGDGTTGSFYMSSSEYSGSVELYLSASNTRGWTLPATYHDGQVHHWAVTLPGSGQDDISAAACYYDGVALSVKGTVATGAQAAWTSGLQLLGTTLGVSAMRVYNRALTPAEAAQNFAAGIDGSPVTLQQTLDAITALQATMVPVVNYCNNPSFEHDSDGDGFADGWVRSFSGSPPSPPKGFRYSLVAGRTRGLAQRIVCTGTADDSAAWIHLAAQTELDSFAAGDPLTVSFYVKGALAGTNAAVYVNVLDASAVNAVDQISESFTVTGSWVRKTYSVASCSATASYIQLIVMLQGIDAGDSLDVSFDDCLIEKAAAASTYWSGVKGGLSANVVAINGDRTRGDAALGLSTLAAGQIVGDMSGDIHGTIDYAGLVHGVDGQRQFDGPWTRHGIILSGTETWEQNRVGEVAVLKDGDTWMMWYSGEDAQQQIGLATATNPLGPWTKYAGSPVLTGYACRTCVVKDGDTFHWFGGGQASGHMTSPNGIAWTPDMAFTGIAANPNGWDAQGAANRCIWKEDDGTWAMLYESHATPTSIYYCGIATAPTLGGPWTQYANNPVLGTPLCNASHPFVIKKDGYYYCWFHGGYAAMTPCDILRASGSDPYHWIIDAWPLLSRVPEDEGLLIEGAGVGDCCVVEDDDTLYLFYDAGGGMPPDPVHEFVASCERSDWTQLADIMAKTNLIGALEVTVTSPVAASGTITVYSGDSYPSSRSRAFTVTVADPTHVMALDGATVDVYLRATQLTWLASNVESVTAGWLLTFEPTIAETAALTFKRQAYKLIACYDNVSPAADDATTLATGELVVVADIVSVGDFPIVDLGVIDGGGA